MTEPSRICCEELNLLVKLSSHAVNSVESYRNSVSWTWENQLLKESVFECVSPEPGTAHSVGSKVLKCTAEKQNPILSATAEKVTHLFLLRDAVSYALNETELKKT